MIKYIDPGGAYWPGAPARDLSDEEWNALPADVRAAVVKAGLYRVDEGGQVMDKMDDMDKVDEGGQVMVKKKSGGGE